MPHHLILSLLIISSLPLHEKNPIFQAVTSEGLAVGEVRVKLSEPTFRDDQTAEQQRAALVEVAGSSRGAEEMLQPSISAPHKLRTQDEKAEGAIIRRVDLTFVVRGVDLDEVKPREAFDQFGGKSTEAGNLRFEFRVLKASDFKDSSGAVPSSENEWLIHSHGRILDRIAVESTERVVASRSEDSLVFASRTDPSFGPETAFPNRWSTITLKSTGEVLGPPHFYVGSVGYVKMTRLKGQEGAIAVEVHVAFAEPTPWFDGAPILRSKFGLIAQDQVRRLRRELFKEKK